MTAAALLPKYSNSHRLYPIWSPNPRLVTSLFDDMEMAMMLSHLGDCDFREEQASFQVARASAFLQNKIVI